MITHRNHGIITLGADQCLVGIAGRALLFSRIRITVAGGLDHIRIAVAASGAGVGTHAAVHTTGCGLSSGELIIMLAGFRHAAGLAGTILIGMDAGCALSAGLALAIQIVMATGRQCVVPCLAAAGAGAHSGAAGDAGGRLYNLSVDLRAAEVVDGHTADYHRIGAVAKGFILILAVFVLGVGAILILQQLRNAGNPHHRNLLNGVFAAVSTVIILVDNRNGHVGLNGGQSACLILGVISSVIDLNLHHAGVGGVGPSNDLEAGAGEGEGGSSISAVDLDLGQGVAAVIIIGSTLIVGILTVFHVLIHTLLQTAGAAAKVAKAVVRILVVGDAHKVVLIVDHISRQDRDLLVQLDLVVNVDAVAQRGGAKGSAIGLLGGVDRNGHPQVVLRIHEVHRGEEEAFLLRAVAVTHRSGVSGVIVLDHRCVIDHDPGFQAGTDSQVDGLLAAVVDDDVGKGIGHLGGIPAILTLGHQDAGPLLDLIVVTIPAVQVDAFAVGDPAIGHSHMDSDSFGGVGYFSLVVFPNVDTCARRGTQPQVTGLQALAVSDIVDDDLGGVIGNLNGKCAVIISGHGCAGPTIVETHIFIEAIQVDVAAPACGNRNVDRVGALILKGHTAIGIHSQVHILARNDAQVTGLDCSVVDDDLIEAAGNGQGEGSILILGHGFTGPCSGVAAIGPIVQVDVLAPALVHGDGDGIAFRRGRGAVDIGNGGAVLGDRNGQGATRCDIDLGGLLAFISCGAVIDDDAGHAAGNHHRVFAGFGSQQSAGPCGIVLTLNAVFVEVIQVDVAPVGRHGHGYGDLITILLGSGAVLIGSDPNLSAGFHRQIVGLCAAAVIDDHICRGIGDIEDVEALLILFRQQGAGPAVIEVIAAGIPVIQVDIAAPALGSLGMDREGLLGLSRSHSNRSLIGGLDGDGSLPAGVNAQRIGLLAGRTGLTIVDDDVGDVTGNLRQAEGSVTFGVGHLGTGPCGIVLALNAGFVPVVQVDIAPALGHDGMHGGGSHGVEHVRSQLAADVLLAGQLDPCLIAHAQVQVGGLVIGHIALSIRHRTADDDVGNVSGDIQTELAGSASSHLLAGEGSIADVIVVPPVQVDAVPCKGYIGVDRNRTHIRQRIAAGVGVVADLTAITGNLKVHGKETIVSIVLAIGPDTIGIIGIENVRCEIDAVVIGLVAGVIQIRRSGIADRHQLGQNAGGTAQQLIVLEQLAVCVQIFGLQAVVQNVGAVLHIGNIDGNTHDGELALLDTRLTIVGVILQIHVQVEDLGAGLGKVDQQALLTALPLDQIAVIHQRTVLISQYGKDLAGIVSGRIKEVRVLGKLAAGAVAGCFSGIVENHLFRQIQLVVRPLIVDRVTGNVDPVVGATGQIFAIGIVGIASAGGSDVDGVVKVAFRNLIVIH